MNATSASRAESARPVLVWDAPVRVFHWLMVLCFAGAYLSAESETWRLLHVTLGYTMGGLVAFRLVWGFAGTRYARFSEFVRGPGAVVQYVRAMLQGRPAHHVGHNPLGALSILAVLALTLAVAATGYARYNELAGEWIAEWHEGIANTMLAIIAIHVAGVVAASRMHRENLARAMLSGYKTASPQAGIRRAWWSLAGVILIGVAVFWTLQWRSTAAALAEVPPAHAATATGAHS